MNSSRITLIDLPKIPDDRGNLSFFENCNQIPFDIEKTVTLNRPNFGLHIIPGIWRDISNFSSGSICLVLASELYDEKDYIRSYEDFLEIKSDLHNSK